MARQTRSDLLSRVYHDPKNYPYGFSRSGDFSINEAKALSSQGVLINALMDGSFAPENSEDNDLLAVMNGDKEPATVTEKAWSKYIKRINRQRTGSIYGRKTQSADDSDDDGTDVDLDTDTDTDIEIEQDED